MFNSFLIIPVVSVYVITAFDYIDKIKVKLALAIPAGAPITLADAMIQTPLLVARGTIKILSM